MTATNRPRVWRATDLDAARSIDWLASRRIVAGATNYMLGPEGIGKSLFLMWLTAKISTGEAVPQFGIPARPPRGVILVLTEDDWGSIVRPRLEVAGADLAYVNVICEDKDGSGSPTFPEDMPSVYEAAPGAAVVMVDAWADTLPANLSVKDPQQARQALHPWKEFSTRTGITVLLSGHTNREKGGNVRNAYGMTGELRKKARMTILAQPDPDEEGVLVIGPEKSNVAAPTAASRFRIDAVQVFTPTDASDGTVPRLTWIGDAEQSARDFFIAGADEAEPSDRTERDEAADWMFDYLARNGGRAPRADVLKAGAAARFSERTLKRAMAQLKVVSERHGFPAVATWALPENARSGPVGPVGPPQLGQLGPYVSERGPTTPIGPTGTDLRKCDDHRGPTVSVGPRDPQLGQLGQAKKSGPTAGPTADGPSWATGPACRLCGGPIDPASGDIHPSCDAA